MASLILAAPPLVVLVLVLVARWGLERPLVARTRICVGDGAGDCSDEDCSGEEGDDDDANVFCVR